MGCPLGGGDGVSSCVRFASGGTEFGAAADRQGSFFNTCHPSLPWISFPKRVPSRARFQTSWNDENSCCATVSQDGEL